MIRIWVQITSTMDPWLTVRIGSGISANRAYSAIDKKPRVSNETCFNH